MRAAGELTTIVVDTAILARELGRELRMRTRYRFISAAVTAFVMGGLLAIPVVGSAHCSADQGTSSLIIIGNVDDADFYSSTNVIDTDSLQTWGAPWCQITDRHYVQKYESGAWVTKASVTWTSYKSVDSGWHPGYTRLVRFTSLTNGSWRFKCSAYRISSHQQLFGLPIGDQFQHLSDTHTSYETGSL